MYWVFLLLLLFFVSGVCVYDGGSCYDNVDVCVMMVVVVMKVLVFVFMMMLVALDLFHYFIH